MFNRAITFIDTHPRTGWYVAAIVTLNFLLDIISKAGIL